MNTSEKIKKELKELFGEGKELMELKDDPMDLGDKYQVWYSRAYKLVEALAPERLNEFISHYLSDPKRKYIDSNSYTIQDYIKLTDVYGLSIGDETGIVFARLTNQFQIVKSLSSRIDSVLQDVTGHLFAEIQDSELKAAIQLKKISKRAAGALAGVVLERHLQRVAVNHNISISKRNPTISDLNEPLKGASIYDVPMWRKIQYLGDIRNLCSHQKDTEPTDEQVTELIDGVNAVIKNIF
uniref:hypothetical protein n=1 Tax=Candidatus Electronema sp. TaxID=2698783 RepID=UPI004057817D